MNFGKRILILAAHPDDEVVACAAAIGRAQTEGAEIFALYLTHGCILREAMWMWDRKNYESRIALRRAEGEAAAYLLGIEPVGWSSRPARHLWREMQESHAEIEAAIAQNKIDQIWLPAYEGGNADHDALNAIGSVLHRPGNVHRPDSLPPEGRVRVGGPQPAPPFALEFAEYNFSDGKAHSQKFPHHNATEQTLTLTPAEQEKKRVALALYKSEKGNLDYVKTERECYRPLAAYDYAQPPHEGTLWYARFHWIPFRHPRVDFSRPEEVRGAIKGFLG